MRCWAGEKAKGRVCVGLPMQELATGYGLIEGPLWDPAKGLYFSDVLGGGIYLLDRTDKVSLAVPKRRGVGGMARHADGGLVAGGRDIVHVSLADHAMKVLLDARAAGNATGFNDLATDAKGRIYVGSLAYPCSRGRSRGRATCTSWTSTAGRGHCRRRAAHQRPRLLAGRPAALSLRCPARAGARLRRGRRRLGRPLARLSATGPGSVPDGLKVAADGSVWVADAHGGRVAVFGTDDGIAAISRCRARW